MVVMQHSIVHVRTCDCDVLFFDVLITLTLSCLSNFPTVCVDTLSEQLRLLNTLVVVMTAVTVWIHCKHLA